MRRKKKRSKKKNSFLIDINGGIDSYYLDALCSQEDLTPISLRRDRYVEDALSTGSLVCDLITGGGWAPNRWITLFGPEASGKSTLLYQAIKEIVAATIPGEFFDHETSLDPVYAGGILEVRSIDDVFGRRGENGKWEVLPKCRYHQPDLGEPVLRYIHSVLKALPDKLYRDGQWYLVFSTPPGGTTTKKERKKNKIKSKFSEKLLTETGKYWFPVPDGKMQMVWFIDSLPAMVPEAKDEDSSKNPLGSAARMFSTYIPLIKSKLGRKRCAVVAVNQLRERIGKNFGNPEYEPCGNAPRFYSDIRLRLSAVSAPGGSGMLEEEPSWDKNGKDVYRYVNIRTIKNKVFVPFRKSVIRIWVSHNGQSGFGFDPFWDTYQYLIETGQIEGTKRGFRLTIPGPWNNRRWKWNELKELILNPNKRIVAKRFRLRKPADLRSKCKKQLRTGEAFNLYFKKIA